MIQVKIANKNGIHARPAGKLTCIALDYKGNIYLEKDGIRCNARSVISIMGLNLMCGDTVKISAFGKDSDKAEEKIKAIIENMVDD